MGCLTAERRALILAQIATKEGQLDDANTALSELIRQINEEYKFNSNEGSQQARKRKLDEYKKIIEWLEADINRLYRQLECKGPTSLNLRRKYRGTYRRPY